MSTGQNTEILLGCDPQVRVVIIEDQGNLAVQVFAEDPANTDLDALFFNLTDDSISANLTIYPSINIEDVTGFDVATGQLNQMNNGAQIADPYDVRIEFGQLPDTSQGDTDQAMFTLYVDGEVPLTAQSIDLSDMTAVVNSDSGNGLALTGGNGGAAQTPVLVTAASEDFDGLADAEDSSLVSSADHWDVRHDQLFTNGCNDGTLMLEQVDTEGPVTLSFDATGVNVARFENSGRYADSLRVEVQIDGGEWVLLDEFAVNDEGTALVGAQTGQTITSSGDTLSYSGGVLDGASDNVQFRFVSDISAYNEQIRIDNIEIQATELVGDTTGVPVDQVAASEDFEGLHDPDDSAEIVDDGHWEIEGGELKTDGHNDGQIWFAETDVDGPATISFDARAPHTNNFEDGGSYGDTLDVWVLIDGETWEHLDTFVVNEDGTALVGSETGQTITADSQTISYSGGALDDAESVQLYINSDISAGNEEIFFDNYEIVETVDGIDDGETCEDFEDAAAGDVAAMQFDGVTISAQRAGDAADSQNDAMIFDTDAPTGGDHDLSYSDHGNVIIISEDNDSSDPDDNAGGGTITFEFDEVSDVTSLNVLDVEEEGGSIDLYDVDGELINSIAIPAAGDNSDQEIAINATGVATMEVTLSGSGAVDDLCYTTPVDPEADCAQYEVTYDDLLNQPIDDHIDDNDQQQDDMMADAMV